MLVGVVPFGLVAGATPVTKHLGGAIAVGFSVIVFAGASQLAAINVLGSGGSVWIATAAALTINLRLVLYSASLAPHVSRERVRTRLLMGYLLVDQAYAISIARWGTGDDPAARVPYFLGGALTLWTSWQLSTIVGALVGAAVPKEIPLSFAVPLVFLVLLVPAVNGRAPAVAAFVGGLAAVGAAELGAGNASLMVGAVAGILAGALAESRWPPITATVVPEPSG